MLTFLATVLTALSPSFVASAPLAPVQESLPASAQSATQEPTLEERLAVLVERMESERIANHIPGFALAVVVDDEVVLARGFGLADVETGRPVEADTIFAIGSSTKAFTATVIGMLQDDGVLDLDDPVTKYLPAFDLPIQGPDKAGDSTVVLRDLLSHRTGFTRMSMLWGGGSVPRSKVLETAVKAEPWAGFRERFLYSNVMFLAAGMASAAAAGQEWETLVQERIFAPLGMSSSTLAVADAQRDERLSLGYEWNTDTESYDHKQMLNLGSIGPAGCINSNVEDMAHWVRFQLAGGTVDGERLISKEVLDETWSPQMSMGGESSYGLGWMLHDREGARVIEHGGNIDGFGAEVAFMPDAGVGFVLLTNVTATPLQHGSIGIVFDALLGDLDDDAAISEDLDEYVGDYIANFASFDNATFEVSAKEGVLAVNVPGQMNYELKSPDEEGKRYFRLTNTVAVSFERDDTGAVVGMQMHQGGMNFELPREGVAIEAEIPVSELTRFLGTYENADVDMQFEAKIQNQRLALDVPDQMVFELRLPDAEGKRFFRISDEIAVRFNETEGGTVVSATFFEKDKVREFERLNAPEAEPSGLPSVAELMALRKQGGRALLLAEHGTLRTHGTVDLVQSGLEGTYRMEARLEPQAMRLVLDFGEFGKVQFGCADGAAWSSDPVHANVPLSGSQLRQLVRNHPAVLEGDWGEAFDSIVVRRVEQSDEPEGHEVIVVQATWSDLPTRTFHVDRETGRVLHMEFMRDAGIVKLPSETTYSDFREVEGVMLYHTSVEQTDWSGRTVLKLEGLEVGVELAPDFHTYTASGE